MNKIVSFFLAPVAAFFLPQVYRDAARSRGSRGVLYIAYMSFLFAALVLGIFIERSAISDEFIHWIKKEIPVVLWTPKGLSLENGRKTAVLTHPVHGPIAVLDMDRTDVTEKDMGQLYFFLTSKKIFFRQITEQIDMRDVTKTTLPPRDLPKQARFTGELIENYYRNEKRTFLLATPGVVFLGFFVVLLFVNLIYSAAGLLLNRIRTRRLNYGAIFNLACFSTGISMAVFSLTLIGLFFSFPLPALLVPVSFCISLLYMLAAVTLITDTPGS